MIETLILSLIVRPYADSSEVSYTTILFVGKTLFVYQNNSCVENNSGGTSKNYIGVEINSGCTSDNNSSVKNNRGGTKRKFI